LGEFPFRSATSIVKRSSDYLPLCVYRLIPLLCLHPVLLSHESHLLDQEIGRFQARSRVAADTPTSTSIIPALGWLMVLITAAAYFTVYIGAAIVSLDPCHLFTCWAQFMLISTSYTNILSIYALCNFSDMTWGHKQGARVPNGTKGLGTPSITQRPTSRQNTEPRTNTTSRPELGQATTGSDHTTATGLKRPPKENSQKTASVKPDTDAEISTSESTLWRATSSPTSSFDLCLQRAAVVVYLLGRPVLAQDLVLGCGPTRACSYCGLWAVLFSTGGPGCF
jgi:hypothetical protein